MLNWFSHHRIQYQSMHACLYVYPSVWLDNILYGRWKEKEKIPSKSLACKQDI